MPYLGDLICWKSTYTSLLLAGRVGLKGGQSALSSFWYYYRFR